MEFSDIIVIGVIALILGGAVTYIARAKKRGQKCIGCPYSDCCKKDCSQEKEDT